MNQAVIPTLLFVPGLRDHVEDHWQTLYAAKMPGSHTVPPLEHDKLSCEARVEALEAALARIEGPVVLVAHSAGVMITVHWAQKYKRPIQGALLAAPADLESPLPAGYPSLEAIRASGWLPIPRVPLPFPSIVAASTGPGMRTTSAGTSSIPIETKNTDKSVSRNGKTSAITCDFSSDSASARPARNAPSESESPAS